MVFRVLSMSLILAGVVLIGVAGYGYFTEPPPGPALVVPQTDIELSDLRTGGETEFTVPVHNNSKHPIKVVGIAWC
jgi:hypothetical protein